MTLTLILLALFHVAIWAAYLFKKLNRAALLIGLYFVAAMQVASVVIRIMCDCLSWWIVLLPLYAPLVIVVTALVSILLYLVFVYKIKLHA